MKQIFFNSPASLSFVDYYSLIYHWFNINFKHDSSSPQFCCTYIIRHSDYHDLPVQNINWKRSLFQRYDKTLLF